MLNTPHFVIPNALHFVIPNAVMNLLLPRAEGAYDRAEPNQSKQILPLRYGMTNRATPK